MTSSRCKPSVWFAAAARVACVGGAGIGPAGAARHHQGRLRQIVFLLAAAAASRANPMDITVIVSFNRVGAILGQPRITYESANAGDNDRITYRIAVMETLQRCTPLPFTEGLGGAVAGRPFAVQFQNPQTSTQT